MDTGPLLADFTHGFQNIRLNPTLELVDLPGLGVQKIQKLVADIHAAKLRGANDAAEAMWGWVDKVYRQNVSNISRQSTFTGDERKGFSDAWADKFNHVHTNLSTADTDSKGVENAAGVGSIPVLDEALQFRWFKVEDLITTETGNVLSFSNGPEMPPGPGFPYWRVLESGRGATEVVPRDAGNTLLYIDKVTNQVHRRNRTDIGPVEPIRMFEQTAFQFVKNNDPISFASFVKSAVKTLTGIQLRNTSKALCDLFIREIPLATWDQTGTVNVDLGKGTGMAVGETRREYQECEAGKRSG